MFLCIATAVVVLIDDCSRMKPHSCKETIKGITIIRLAALLLQLIVVKVLVDANVIIIIVKSFVRPTMGIFHNVSLCNSPRLPQGGVIKYMVATRRLLHRRRH